MRVCFVSRRFFPAISGMSVYALNYFQELVRRGVDVTLVSEYRADARGANVYGGGPPPPVDGVRVVGLESLGESRVNDGLPADFEADVARIVATIVAEHARTPFTILHAQYGYPMGYATLLAARQLRLPVVVSIQGGDGHWVGGCCKTHYQAMREVLHSADAVYIGSESFAQEVVDNLSVDRGVFTIIPGATDTHKFTPVEGRAVGAICVEPVLLYHGRVDARKGIVELLEAVRLLADGGRVVTMLVSGIGPDVDLAKQTVSRLGLGSQVSFLGYTSYAEAPAVYRRGDVFVSPTYSEGFSNTILEAMASGLPVVSTEVVGVVDCLTNEVNSLLVPSQDAASLAAAILRMLGDEGLRVRLATRALGEVRSLYSWQAIAGRILASYDQVLASRTRKDTLPATDIVALPRFCDADLSCRFRRQPHLL